MQPERYIADSEEVHIEKDLIFFWRSKREKKEHLPRVVLAKLNYKKKKKIDRSAALSAREFQTEENLFRAPRFESTWLGLWGAAEGGGVGNNAGKVGRAKPRAPALCPSISVGL